MDCPDAQGRPVRIEATGYAARCLQHETDHLGGRLYIDRLPHRLRRELVRAHQDAEPPPSWLVAKNLQ